MARPRDISPRLARQLEELLAHSYLPGEPIPSLRALADMYGVGRMTVQRVLVVLAERDLVRGHASGGWVRGGVSVRPVSRAAATGTRVGLITSLSGPGWEASAAGQAIRAEAGKRKLAVIEVLNPRHRRLTPASYRIDARRVPWNAFDVGLLVHVEDPATLAQKLFRRRKVVVMDRDARAFGLDGVAYDNAAAGRLAAQHLLDLGHRRFAVLDEVNPPGYPASQPWLERRHGFESAVGVQGGCLRPEWRIAVSRAITKTREFHSILTVLDFWARLKPQERPTALFCFDGHYVPRIVEELALRQMRVPRDLSLIYVTGAAHAPPKSGGRFSLVWVNQAALAGRGLDMAQRLAAEPARVDRAPWLFTIPPLLVAGQSTAAPPEARPGL